MQKYLNSKKLTLLLLLSFMLSSSGCALVDSFIEGIQGSLVGDDFKILVYDDYGNNSLTLLGNKINIGLFENYANNNSESAGFKSEVLEITVDGNQFLHVGSSAVFAESGVDMVKDYDYEYLKDITTTGSSLFIPLERSLNSFSNMIGKKKTIVVKTQLGITIGIYQGDKVYVEVPDDLPQMTRVIIDGKSLYIYRADYEIIDTEILK